MVLTRRLVRISAMLLALVAVTVMLALVLQN